MSAGPADLLLLVHQKRNSLYFLNKFSNTLFLHQIVTKPTHKDGNVLDLVLANNLDIVFGYEVQPGLKTTSHHSSVVVTTEYKVSEDKYHERVPKRSCFYNLNFSHEMTVLSLFYWSQEFRSKTPDEMLLPFYGISYVVAPFDENKLFNKSQHGFRAGRSCLS